MIGMENRRRVSNYLWIPVVWYALVATRGVSHWFTNVRDVSDFDYMEGEPLDRAVYLVLIVVGLVIVLSKRIDWRKYINENRWLIILYLYMLVSISWSFFPEIAFKRWVKAVGALLMATIVLGENYSLDGICAVLRRVIYVHLPLSIVTIKYFRDIGVQWSKDGNQAMWTGLTTHKNVLGQICMTSGIFLMWDITRSKDLQKKAFSAIYMLMVIYLMFGPGYSRSITAIFGCTIGILLLWMLKYIQGSQVNISRYFWGAAVFLAFTFVIGDLSVQVFSSKQSVYSAAVMESGRDATLTGRTELWKDILEIASNQYGKGVGYGSFWIGNLGNNLWDKYTWKPGQGHNGYIDVYVELGLIGIVLFILMLFQGYKNISGALKSDFNYGSLRLVLFVVIIVHNISESSFLRPTHNLWFIFLLVLLNVSLKMKGNSLS